MRDPGGIAEVWDGSTTHKVKRIASRAEMSGRRKD
jgi:hypothetical protein